jgi:nucleotide-binding universal stress UspA family protein
MKILVPVDGSACTASVLDWLVGQGALASERHRLVMLHVVASLSCHVKRWMSPAALEDVYDAEAQPVWHLVRGFLKAHHTSATCRREVGDAARWIAKIATDEEFDLIVMGSHGHGALANVALGSVASRVLAHCKTPVLLVR